MLRYVCHPEVVVDPAVAVPRWHLSEIGVARMRAFAGALSRPGVIWASTECKAIEATGVLAGRHGMEIRVHAGLDENDRSSTGYLALPEFEAAADAFFAAPEESFRGWERAVDAQARVLAVWREIEAENVVIVGHGGTGTLLLCALAGLAIERRHDAPRQGCHWVWDGAGVRHGWRELEAL